MPRNEFEQYMPKLQKIKMFQCLPEADLKILLAESEVLYCKKGEKIISQGDLSHNFYAIIHGSVLVSVTDKDEEVVINTITEGEMFGEAAIFIGEKRTANVTSSEETIALQIHKADMLSFIKNYPKAGIKILMYVISGLLTKLKDANLEIVIEKQSNVELDDIDPMIQEIIRDI